MTAAQKLRERLYPVMDVERLTLTEALAIMAVVEAVEPTLASFKKQMDAWSYAEYDGHKHTYEELAPDLTAALAALEEALS